MATESFATKFSKFWFWFSQITSLIGLSSILENIRLWYQFVEWLEAKVKIKIPGIYDLLLQLSYLAHSAIGVWRAVTHPVIQFLLSWLPLRIPSIVVDLIAISIFWLLGMWRSGLFWKRYYAKRTRLIEAHIRSNDIKDTYGSVAMSVSSVLSNRRSSSSLAAIMGGLSRLDDKGTADDPVPGNRDKMPHETVLREIVPLLDALKAQNKGRYFSVYSTEAESIIQDVLNRHNISKTRVPGFTSLLKDIFDKKALDEKLGRDSSFLLEQIENDENFKAVEKEGAVVFDKERRMKVFVVSVCVFILVMLISDYIFYGAYSGR